MAIVKLKPTTPGNRGRRVNKKDVCNERALKSLRRQKNRINGRNNAGRITVRHRGGGHKKQYRIIDFKRHDKFGIPAKVERIEHDPNRSANIALLCYLDGERRYIIAPNKIQVGDTVIANNVADIKPGNMMPMKNIPLGTVIHCIEMKPGKGAQMVRSAGASAQLVSKDNSRVMVRLRSGERRILPEDCVATIGEVSNGDHNLINLGKAGAKRWRGVRPTVRGVAMNPVDHPHGGGEGRTSGGRHPVSPWGVQTKGKKTRRKPLGKFIIRKRSK